MATPDPIRILVGSDKFQHARGAELTLEYSIRRNTKRPVDIRFMRAGDPDWPVSENGDPLGSWKLGRPVDLAWPKKGLGTPFSGFRFAIPETMGFKGKAIYLDADQLVLGDIGEVWDQPIKKGYLCCHPHRTDVSLIDCGWFADQYWWPRVSMMKASGWRVIEYVQLLWKHGATEATLPWEWNDLDGKVFARQPRLSKLIHYTTVVDCQPWRPYPCVSYPNHFPYCRVEAAGRIWWDYYQAALADKHGPEEALRLVQEAAAPERT